jgi:hypothetical protein
MSGGGLSVSGIRLSPGTYAYQVYSPKYGVIDNANNQFTITDFINSVPDTINTTKAVYLWNETVTMFGNAANVDRLRVYLGGTVVTEFGNVAGAFTKTTTLNPGHYNAVLERATGMQPPNDYSSVISTAFIVSPNPNTLSVTMLDPHVMDCATCNYNQVDRKFVIGNTYPAKGGTTNGGVFITVQYNQISNADTIVVASPTNPAFQTFTANGNEVSFYVPNVGTSIGLWTATITHNSTSNATSTLQAFLYNNFINNAGVTGSAEIQISNQNPCPSETLSISWTTTALPKYVVRLYKENSNVNLLSNSSVYYATSATIPIISFVTSGTYWFQIIAFNNDTQSYASIVAQNSLVVKTDVACGSAGLNQPSNPNHGVPTTNEMTDGANNLLWMLFQRAFYGLVIFIGFIYTAIKMMTKNGGQVASGALVFISVLILNFEAIIGLFDPYKWYVLAIIWIFAGLYWQLTKESV